MVEITTLVQDGVTTTADNKPKLLELIGRIRYGLVYAGMYEQMQSRFLPMARLHKNLS